MNINIIPTNTEKYLSIQLGKNIIFLDSFQFMPQALNKLVDNLPENEFILTSKLYQNEKLKLLKRKGVYPYDYMDSTDKFNNKLPNKNYFYSLLNDEHISEEDYNHAQTIWNTFQMKTMGDYHDLYLTSDILLLSDVFEKFRKTCLLYYKLDPLHYFSSPGLSWDSMLKMTGIILELISDIDIHLMVKNGERGGVSYIANRYSKANNPFVKNYNPNEDTNFIMLLDENNLYGWAMSQPLPTGNFLIA